MKNKLVVGIFFVLLCLVIGYAGYITDLVINQTTTISTNTSDYDVIFANSSIDGTAVSDVISEDNKTMTFTLGAFSTSGNTHYLDYKIINNATMYDTKVSITCNIESTVNATMTNSLADELVLAKTSKDGRVTIVLNEDLTSEVNFNCEAKTIPQERDEVVLNDPVKLSVTLDNLYASESSTNRSLDKYNDDGTDIYYYKGKNALNNVIYNGICYKIVRTIKDGSFKLIYNGIPTDNTCNNYQNNSILPTSSKYNDDTIIKTDYTYLDNGVETSSLVKNVCDEWYKESIDKAGITSNVVDAGYCNDRTTYLDEEITKYNSYDRITSSLTPSFVCETSDTYTVDNTSGNGLLTYKVAMISADEVLLAGEDSFFNSVKDYWTMTPARCSDTICEVFIVNASGKLEAIDVKEVKGVRPVIAVTKDVMVIKGVGTINNPYILDVLS